MHISGSSASGDNLHFWEVALTLPTQFLRICLSRTSGGRCSLEIVQTVARKQFVNKLFAKQFQNVCVAVKWIFQYISPERLVFAKLWSFLNKTTEAKTERTAERTKMVVAKRKTTLLNFAR